MSKKLTKALGNIFHAYGLKNIVKMTSVPKTTYKFTAFFTKIEQTLFKFVWNPKANNQNNPKKKE